MFLIKLSFPQLANVIDIRNGDPSCPHPDVCTIAVIAFWPVPLRGTSIRLLDYSAFPPSISSTAYTVLWSTLAAFKSRI